jgi:hypothetical protein
MIPYETLRLAIEFIREGRPDRIRPVDDILVQQHVQEPTQIRCAGFPTSQPPCAVPYFALDHRLASFSGRYDQHRIKSVELDKDFRASYAFGELTHAIAASAIRFNGWLVNLVYHAHVLIRQILMFWTHV